MSISANGRVTGNINYSISKALTSALGINSLKDLRDRANEPRDDAEGNEFDPSICPNPIYKEDSNNYIIECSLRDAILANDEDFSVTRSGDRLTFSYRQNINDTDSDDGVIKVSDAGSVRINLIFNSNILEVIENKSGLVKRSGMQQASISGTATEPMDIKIIAAAGDDSTILALGPIPNAVRERASAFKIAPRDFGGIVEDNFRFVRSNSPYRVNRTIQVPAGKTVYVEEGVTFLSKGSKTKKDSKFASFHVQGDIYFDGSKSKPIKLEGAPFVHIKTAFAKEGSGIYANFIEVFGGENFLWDGDKGATVNFRIHNSRFVNLTSTWEISYPYGANELVRNTFVSSSQIRTGIHGGTGASLLIDGNRFEGRAKSFGKRSCWIENWAYYESTLRVIRNDFSKVEGYALCVFSQDGTIDARGNFWGKRTEKQISELVLDAKDSLNYPSIISVADPLTTMPVFQNYGVIPTSDSNSGSAVSETSNVGKRTNESQEAAEAATKLAEKTARQAKARAEAEKLAARAVAKSSTSKTNVLICKKGKAELTVIGEKPVCPTGYSSKA